jgi:phosphoserine phosphatase
MASTNSLPQACTPALLAAALPAGGWVPANRTALLQLLERLQQAAQAQPHSPPLAVFDWDNTCIFNDIGDATLRYQLSHLQLRLPPQELQRVLPESLLGITHLQGPSDGPLSLVDMKADLLRSYAQLWPAMQGGQVDSVRGGQAHCDFRAKFGALYLAIEHAEALGPKVAFPLLLQMFAHYSDAEVEAMARGAWQMAAAEPVGHAHWRSATAGAAGFCQFGFATHVALHAEMLQLITALSLAGAKVAVVSASFEPIVRGIQPLLHTGLPPGSVFGMRQPGPTGEPVPYPVTYRSGKVEVIQRYLGGAPWLVAGDTNTDYEMLTQFPSTQINLVIHRHVQGPITELHRQAQQDEQSPDKSAASPSSQILLQGRNEETATFWPQTLSSRASPEA